MEDRELKILSLLLTAAGIAGLAAISIQNEYTPVRVYEINENMIGKRVVVNGTIYDISLKDKNVFMTIEDIGFIKAVAFHPVNISLKKGMNITVYGKVNVYKNELEIIEEKLDIR
ncbi:MAG: hypothetical protein QMD85_03690 [Candidatus Aenigmarchaeota archaeon]|nr:hypothetical protein [Candidatus Aenigmarchaeota archaeon]MDI6722660.1 hypothetical protein [Candidatus Aenigmarchaeota archaeon]